MAENTEMFINSEGIVIDGERDVILVDKGEAKEEVVEVEEKSNLFYPKYWKAVEKLDKEAGSSGEDFAPSSQKLRTPQKKAGRPKSKKKASTKRGRPVVNQTQWSTDCDVIFNYLDTGINPHPRGGNKRRELPRTAKRYFIKNGQLFLMKENRVKKNEDMVDRTELSECFLTILL